MLSVGGFTQPGVAKSLIETPSNAEKGLSHRFLWMFPNPLFQKFSNLSAVDGDFIKSAMCMFSTECILPMVVALSLSVAGFGGVLTTASPEGFEPLPTDGNMMITSTRCNTNLSPSDSWDIKVERRSWLSIFKPDDENKNATFATLTFWRTASRSSY